mmetsp:Transcript_54604/g.159398  ORF Transcript_54604/g.159398 Transcript_54604/m.159398 type:complete len:294 (+) Transcript_54604:54-935(+)
MLWACCSKGPPDAGSEDQPEPPSFLAACGNCGGGPPGSKVLAPDGVPDLPDLPSHGASKLSFLSVQHGDLHEGAWSSVQQQVNECLDSGLAFVSGTWLLTPGSRHQLTEAAGLLSEHPRAGVAVVGYSARPNAQWSTKARCEELSFRRAAAVRDALQQAGCKNRIVARGLGHIDEQGPRCEVVLCDDRVLSKLESEEAAAAAARKQQLQVLHVEFDSNGSKKVVDFKKVPLGISFDKSMPSAVTEVEPGSQADKLGVKVGWVFSAVNGQSLEGRDWSTMLAMLEQGSVCLPRA